MSRKKWLFFKSNWVCLLTLKNNCRGTYGSVTGALSALYPCPTSLMSYVPARGNRGQAPPARVSVLSTSRMAPIGPVRGDAPGSLRKGAGWVSRRGPVPPDAAAGCFPTRLRWSFNWSRQDQLQYVSYHVLSCMRKRFCSGRLWSSPSVSSLSFLSVSEVSPKECRKVFVTSS